MAWLSLKSLHFHPSLPLKRQMGASPELAERERVSEEKERSFPGEGPLAQESLIGKWMGWGGRRAEEQERRGWRGAGGRGAAPGHCLEGPGE